MLSILCVRLTIKVKVEIPESFKVGWYPPKKTGSSHLNDKYKANVFYEAENKTLFLEEAGLGEWCRRLVNPCSLLHKNQLQSVTGLF